MRVLSPASPASPAGGVLRGLRAGALAVLCVLLPLAGHVLSQGHAPGWLMVVATAAVAVPGAVVLTRRQLTDTQLLGTLAVAQLVHHLAYALPGACAAAARADGPGGAAWLLEHLPVTELPPGGLSAGHLVALLLAARLLGVTERLLWQSRPLLTAVRRLLLFIWPVFGRAFGTGPRVAFRVSTSPLRSAVMARHHAGRAPPRRGRASLTFFRPMPIGGPCLP
ncbi:hypothetical protein [Streptomyces cadmiisoli]|uniref:hypothetical protein n=1 Tax=Streptomyces cadmiisoli TaxID=2184053 RepID=UPI00366412D9